MALKAVHYINQFYAGLGGEEMADTGFGILDKLAGPAIGLNAAWKGEMTIVKIIYCGDNYVNVDDNWEEVKGKIKAVLDEEQPDVFIAGPAFNEGAPYGYTPKGGTGSAVRTLVRLIEVAGEGELG